MLGNEVISDVFVSPPDDNLAQETRITRGGLLVDVRGDDLVQRHDRRRRFVHVSEQMLPQVEPISLRRRTDQTLKGFSIRTRTFSRR